VGFPIALLAAVFLASAPPSPSAFSAFALAPLRSPLLHTTLTTLQPRGFRVLEYLALSPVARGVQQFFLCLSVLPLIQKAVGT